jgi:hypothetical protein
LRNAKQFRVFAHGPRAALQSARKESVMNKKAILAALVVAASSTAAFADPYVVQAGVQASVQGSVAPAATVTVRDHRDADDRDANLGQPRDVDGQFMRDHRRLPLWSVLSSSDRLSNGRTTIRLSSWKKYSELKLQATRGTFDIAKIQIKFRNGQTQVLRTDADLNAQNPALTINLDGNRPIASISVFGTGGRRAQFEILGA